MKRRETSWARFRLVGPRLYRIHKEGVNASKAQPPENAACKRAAPFPRDEHVGTRSPFRKRQIPVFLDDELAPQRHHKQDAQPAAQKRKWENAPEGELRAKAQKNQSRDCKHDPRSK